MFSGSEVLIQDTKFEYFIPCLEMFIPDADIENLFSMKKKHFWTFLYIFRHFDQMARQNLIVAWLSTKATN